MILIRGAQIVDGSGRAPFRADVLIQGDKISAIGNFPQKAAETVVDGLGFYLTPGFIDVNSDSDHHLAIFTNPSQKDFLLQGVTTLIGGHCGASLAPLLYGTLESVRKWTDVNQINVDWHTMAEFFKTLGRLKLGVNFGTLVGHSTIRRALVGEELRELTERELIVFKKILSQALAEGALGLSTGLGYVHARQTPYSEIKELLKTVREFGGIYTTHLRNEREGLLGAINETINIAKETGVKTIISHFRPMKDYEKDFLDGMRLVEKSNFKDIYFDMYPFDVSVAPIYTLLPLWAQTGGLEVMLANIKTPDLRKKILNELPKIESSDVIVAVAQGADYLVGKSVGQIAENRNLSLNEALLELMEITNMRALVLYKNINEEVLFRALASERALIGSNAASLPETRQVIKHGRFYNTFPKFLNVIAQTKDISFEEAIKKLTSVPARIFNLKNRGLIKEGYVADLVLLKNNKANSVWVNGQLAVKDGNYQGVMAGKILTRS